MNAGWSKQRALWTKVGFGPACDYLKKSVKLPLTDSSLLRL
jgi:hypothetical protein